ncbi:MAG: ABC transporter ATP-binding protein [Phycisphaerae bacterium]
MINVVDVTHHYGIRPILKHVSLRVEQGELLALMGPNGMGKSTLLGVISGLLSPIKGYVEIAGKRRRSTPENELAIRQLIAYLPAEAWFPPAKTGREWLVAVGQLYGIEDEHLMDHLDRLLALFDLTKQADSVMASYSTGQKRKITICATLITEAPILLLDEPFSGGLDPSAILALKRVLEHLAKSRAATILMATPVPELVAELAHRIAVIHQGQLVACATLDGLRQQTGIAGDLSEVYEQLVNPEIRANLDRYFAGQAR